MHLARQGGLSARLADHELLALIIAAAAHDVGHPGVTNSFLVQSDHALALQYNDKSVLENLHAAVVVRLLRGPDSPIAHLAEHTQHAVRCLIIDLILATDLTQHFKIVGELKAATLVESRSVDTHLLCRAALKCADIGHPTKPLALHLEWSRRCFEEFYQQGDQERALGLPVSPFCDRYDRKEGKSQKGFIDALVRPLVSTFCAAVGSSLWMRHVDENDAYWARKLEEEKRAALLRPTRPEGARRPSASAAPTMVESAHRRKSTATFQLPSERQLRDSFQFVAKEPPSRHDSLPRPDEPAPLLLPAKKSPGQ
jgi:hypothetical protein